MTLTERERNALARGLARIYRGRVIPIMRGGEETEEEKAAREAAEAKAAADAAAAAKDKTFSQADVDRIVQERVARVKTTPPADYDDLKNKAEEFDKLQDEQKTELEKEREARAKAEQTAEKATATANTRLVEAAVLTQAAKHGALKPEHMHKLINTAEVTVGDDGQVTGAEEAVKAFLDANPEYVGTPANSDADQGARGGAKDQLTEAELKKMRPEEIVKARKEGRLTSLGVGS